MRSARKHLQAATDRAAASRRHDVGAADPLVLLLDVEPILAALYEEWLADAGMRVASFGVREAVTPALAAQAQAAVVDLPFPRRSGGERLRQHAHTLPGTPILVLSPTFHAGIASHGAVALELGVAAVLASPVRREALIDAINEVMNKK